MNQLVRSSTSHTSLSISTMEEAFAFAKAMANSGMVPKDFKGNPDACLVAIQWGSEIGLAPMQAVQNIAVINGRPSLWGDAALAVVLAHPACEGVEEDMEGEGDGQAAVCTVKRAGRRPVVRRFSVADAKKAKLWGKEGPWQTYPERMLQARARGFALRDAFPDAMRGMITREEAQDIDEPKVVQNTARRDEPAPREVSGEIIAPKSTARANGTEANAYEAMAWPLKKKDGGYEDYRDAEPWQETILRWIEKIQTATSLPMEMKPQLLMKLREDHRPIFAMLSQRGFPGVVEDVEAVFASALGEKVEC